MNLTATEWLAALDSVDGPLASRLTALYPRQDLLMQKRILLRGLVEHFQSMHGAIPFRIFRAPGRINLRGMHVDTHGGWLNLMTHHRSIYIAAAPAATSTSSFSSLQHPQQTLELNVEDAHRAFNALGSTWEERIQHPQHVEWLATRRGQWENYCLGATLRAREALGPSMKGIRAVITSDLPEGASLSSSAALCVGLVQSLFALNRFTPASDALVLAARDAEWFTGARTGTGDQAAIVFGRPDAVMHFAPPLAGFSAENARWVKLPESVQILVINSRTPRSLSGSAQSAYVRTRFAYSLALRILDRLLIKPGRAGGPLALCEVPDDLALLTGLLEGVPERATLCDLETLCGPEFTRKAYTTYFGDAAEAAPEEWFNLRGPLEFGVAESARARVFFWALKSGDLTGAGRLMSIGHDGDRVSGNLRPGPVTSLAELPGAFGASTPALDALVDTACDCGALGASLTGAGLGGAVVALAVAGRTEHIASQLREYMQTATYARLANLAQPLTAQEAASSVEINVAPPAAGELWPATSA